MGVLESAQGAFGKPYIFGAGRNGDPACDCSSYVANVFGANGVSLPAFTDAIAGATALVGTDLSVAQPGDLLLYRYDDPSQPGTVYPHIAIYAGGSLTYACQYPVGSGAFPVLNLPFEVHRVGGVSPGGGFNFANPVSGVFAWVKANPLLAGGLAAAVYLLSGPLQNPSGRVRRNIDAFVGGGGVIHPIRDSKGYDPEVEQMQGEAKVRREQADRYHEMHRGIRRERDTSVDRPPWAVGISNAALERLAHEHGTVASRPLWWEAAGLYSHRQRKQGQRDRGELEDVIGYLRTNKGRAAAPHRTVARERYKKPKPLPW